MMTIAGVCCFVIGVLHFYLAFSIWRTGKEPDVAISQARDARLKKATKVLNVVGINALGFFLLFQLGSLLLR